MLKKLSLFAVCLTVLLLVVCPAIAEDPVVLNCGSYSYHLQEDGSAVIRTYSGAGKNLILPETLDGHPVTTIDKVHGDYVVSVTIPNAVTEILNGNPFLWCEKLQEIIVSEDHPTLEVRDGMLFSKTDHSLICCPVTLPQGDIILPEDVFRIENNAFANCTGLTGINIPSGLREIVGNPFYCYRGLFLENITVAPDNPVFSLDNGLLIDRQAQRVICGFPQLLGPDLVIPEGIREIASNAFSYNSGLQHVTFPAGLEVIGNGAFTHCTSLSDIVLPQGLKFLGDGAFENCSALSKVTLPAGLEKIGKNCFSYCSALEAFPEFPDSLLSIGNCAFYYCSAAGEVTIPAGVTVLPDMVFYRCENLTKLSLSEGLQEIGEDIGYETQLTELILPDSVTVIHDSAFAYIDTLQKIKFPKNLTSLPDSVCAGCESLREAVLPENLEEIGRDAFYKCYHLETVALPETVKIIQFRSLYCLQYLAVPASVEYIGENAVPFILIVPEGSEMEYYCRLNHKQLYRSLDEIGQ